MLCMCSELGWSFLVCQVEMSMEKPDSYERRVQVWYRQLGEELATEDSILNHWELVW